MSNCWKKTPMPQPGPSLTPIGKIIADSVDKMAKALDVPAEELMKPIPDFAASPAVVLVRMDALAYEAAAKAVQALSPASTGTQRQEARNLCLLAIISAAQAEPEPQVDIQPPLVGNPWVGLV